MHQAYIHQIAVDNPSFKYSQNDILSFMLKNLSLKESEQTKLSHLYSKTHIKYRYSVLDSFSPSEEKNNHLAYDNVNDKMGYYLKEATKLGKATAEKVLQNSNWAKTDITHLITVSCTGLSAPGIEQMLSQELGLRKDVELYSVNFMGCYAGFHALKIAKNIILADPKSKVLMVCVELCTLHFSSDIDPDTLLANALFSDGCAALTLSSEPNGFLLQNHFNTLLSNGKSEMGWNIHPNGFKMILSSRIPNLLKEELLYIKPLLEEKLKLESPPERFAIHPGGRKIIHETEKAFDISPAQIKPTLDILENYGNMSSASVFFILNRLLNNGTKGERILCLGFGPGITIESHLMSIV